MNLKLLKEKGITVGKVGQSFQKENSFDKQIDKELESKFKETKTTSSLAKEDSEFEARAKEKEKELLWGKSSEKESALGKTENAHLNELKEKVINQKNGFEDNKPPVIEFHSEKNEINQEDYIDLQVSTLMQNPEKITEEQAKQKLLGEDPEIAKKIIAILKRKSKIA